MLQWIANRLRPAPRRVEIEVVAKFMSEPVEGRIVRTRIVDVRPAGFPTDRRVQLEMYLDDWDEWASVGEFSIEHAEAFTKLIADAVTFDGSWLYRNK